MLQWERVRIAQRQNDTVVKSTRCVTLAQRHNDMVCLFGTVTKRHGASLWHGVSFWHGGSLWHSNKIFKLKFFILFYFRFLSKTIF